MLKRLYISNFALINEMDVTFPGQLSVITGETGAGKSIFLEALGLALGKRVEAGVLKNTSKKCIVEAEFETRDLDLSSFFTEFDIDQEQTLVLRREINPDGKSRSFLNDALVNLAALKALSEKLLDIHSQHQTLLLNQANFQLEVVDAFAENITAFKKYKADFSELNKLTRKLNDLVEQEARARKELDYYQFLFNELEECDVQPGSLKQLEEESAALENAEAIKTGLLSAAHAIHSNDENILSGISRARQSIQSISKHNPLYAAFYERIHAAYIELKELAADLEDAETSVSYDSARLETVNGKMDRLNRLLKKHNVSSEADLLNVKEEIEQKLVQFSTLEVEMQKTKKQIEKATLDCQGQAKELSTRRGKAVPAIEKHVKELLAGLSMENAGFRIELTQQQELGVGGYDQVRFMFSANRGVLLSELHKVASGGELSRLMLSLKALLATKKKLPTIIFDEIDTGVSGEVADKIGRILVNMGAAMQVIAITHLPQMASKGRHHLFVYKKDNEDATVSFIKELTKEERVSEIAKMLSTGNPSVSALKNAKELLNA